MKCKWNHSHPRDDPKNSKTIQILIEDESWIDLGAVASQWGGCDNEATCHTRAAAKETRIDVTLASRDLIPFVKKFEVEKDEGFPTQKVLRFNLSTQGVAQTRMTIRTLPSLKKQVDEKVDKMMIDENLEGKAMTQRRKEERKKYMP